MHFAQEADALESGEAHQDVGVVGAHAVVMSSGKDPWGASLQATAVPVCQERKCTRFATFEFSAWSALGCRRRILRRRASNFPGEVQRHAIQIGPQIQRPFFDELRSLVYPDGLGFAIRGGDPLQGINHVQTGVLRRTSVARARRLKVLVFVRTRIRQQPTTKVNNLGLLLRH